MTQAAAHTGLSTGKDPEAVETSAASRQRIAWIDLAKGAGIFLVALGHLTNGASEGIWLPELDSMHYALYLFHMPLFFLLGGLVLKTSSRSLGAFVAGRARALLVSYYVFSLYFLAKPLVLVSFPELAASFGLAAGEVNLPDTLWHVLVMGEGLWFLWAYFWAELFAFCAVRFLEGHTSELVQRGVELIGGCLLVVCAQAWHIMHVGEDLPFQLLRGLWGAGYVLIGHALGPTMKHLDRPTALVAGIAALAAFVRIDLQLRGRREPLLWGAIIHNGTLGLTSGAVSLLVAVIGSLAVLFLARAWEHFRPLEAVGRESLAYYVLSPLVMNACKFVLFGLARVSLVEAPFGAQLACGVALACASVALSAPLVLLIDRYAPWLFGKAKREK